MGDGIALETFSDECFLEYLATIYSLTGISIAKNKKSMVQGRLRKRIGQLALSGYPEYLERLRQSKEEKEVFINLITTNETYFFRTPRVWDFIEKTFLPEWYRKYPGQVLKVWSAASSSGEEAHSLGIVCQEFKSKNKTFSYQILGTDISQEMISLSSSGCYKGRSIEFFQNHRPDYFKKYLQENEKGFYQVIPEVRSNLKFLTHNLFHEFPLKSSFDLVLLRNVLIYFKQPDQEKVLKNIHTMLKNDGVLIIGESEALSHIQTDFKPRQPLVYSMNEKTGGNEEAA